MILTPAARHWLTHTTSAQVLNVFDRACNLVNQDHDLLTLVTAERGLNPFAMLVDATAGGPFQAVSTSSGVTVSANSLTVGSLQINIELARDWNPMPDWPAVRQTLAAEPRLLNTLTEQAISAAPLGSLFELFKSEGLASLTLVPAAHVVRAYHGPAQPFWLERAGQGALDLVSGLRGGSLEQSMLGAKRLAGLGGGLTPAGDDFIVGVVLAIWAGCYGPEVLSWCESIVGVTTPLTTTLSAAYLRAAAGGECMQLWHSVFEAMIQDNPDHLSIAARALLSIGHTSGADAVAGFLASHLLY